MDQKTVIRGVSIPLIGLVESDHQRFFKKWLSSQIRLQHTKYSTVYDSIGESPNPSQMVDSGKKWG